MININEFFVLAIFAAMVGCGGQDSQQDTDQSQTGTEMRADTLSADSIIEELDKTSQELKSLSDEAQKAIDDLSEDN